MDADSRHRLKLAEEALQEVAAETEGVTAEWLVDLADEVRLVALAGQPTEQPKPWETYPWILFEKLPADVQTRMTLEAIGERRATVTEIRDTMRAQSPDQWCGGDQLNRILRRLCKAGTVASEPGEWGPCRYRYFRLEAPATIDGIDLSSLAEERC